MTVFDKHEKLQKKFSELYCAVYLMESIEREINQYIRSKLGIGTSAKINNIGVYEDPDGFIQLEIFVRNQDLDEVFEKLKDVFPGWEWDIEEHKMNYSDIILRLDDDVIAGIPRFMSDE